MPVAAVLALVAGFVLATFARAQVHDMTAAHHIDAHATPCHSDCQGCGDETPADSCCAKCTPMATAAQQRLYPHTVPDHARLLLSERGLSHIDHPPIPPPRIALR